MRAFYISDRAVVQCLIALVFCLVISSCTSKQDWVNEEINEEFVYRVFAASPEDTIQISSRGGWPEGMIAGEYINVNNISLEVGGYCISACVEYVLSATKQGYLRDSPIIAVHGNPTIYETQKRTLNGEDNLICQGGAVARAYVNFEKTMAISPKYSEHQADILSLVKLGKKQLDNGCYQPLPEYKVDYWLLGTADLNKYFSGNFEGSTCGLREVICRKKLDAFFKKGTVLSDGRETYKTR